MTKFKSTPRLRVSLFIHFLLAAAVAGTGPLPVLAAVGARLPSSVPDQELIQASERSPQSVGTSAAGSIRFGGNDNSSLPSLLSYDELIALSPDKQKAYLQGVRALLVQLGASKNRAGLFASTEARETYSFVQRWLELLDVMGPNEAEAAPRRAAQDEEYDSGDVKEQYAPVYKAPSAKKPAPAAPSKKAAPPSPPVAPKNEIETTKDQVRRLQDAVSANHRAYLNYQKKSEIATDPKEKAMYEKLMGQYRAEEKSKFAILGERQKYLVELIASPDRGRRDLSDRTREVAAMDMNFKTRETRAQMAAMKKYDEARVAAAAAPAAGVATAAPAPALAVPANADAEAPQAAPAAPSAVAPAAAPVAPAAKPVAEKRDTADEDGATPKGPPAGTTPTSEDELKRAPKAVKPVAKPPVDKDKQICTTRPLRCEDVTVMRRKDRVALRERLGGEGSPELLKCNYGGNWSSYDGGHSANARCKPVSSFCFSRGNCSVKPGVELKCSERGTSICNPMIFGVQKDGNAFCVPPRKNMAQLCDGASTDESRMEGFLKLEVPGIRERWNEEVENFRAICGGGATQDDQRRADILAVNCTACKVIAARISRLNYEARGECGDQAPTAAVAPAAGARPLRKAPAVK